MEDIKELLRKSIEENEREARRFLSEERKKQFEKLSLNNGLPPLFKEKSLRDFKVDENYHAYEIVCDFLDKFPNTKGLLLTGGVGVGKSHLAAGIANELNKRLYRTYFGNVLDIISFFKSSYNKNSSISERELIKLITEDIDLLIIDDLGKENNTENTLSLLYQIINKLYENEKPIVITTNYKSLDLSRKLGERGGAIISRISALSRPVQLRGRDRRLSQ